MDTYARRIIIVSRGDLLTFTAYDVQTGVVLARARPPYRGLLGLDEDVIRDRLLLHLQGVNFAPGEFVILDAASLQTVVHVPLNSGGNGPVAELNSAPVGPYVALVMPSCDRLTMHDVDPSLTGSIQTLSP